MSITYKGIRNGGLQKDKDGQISTSRIFLFLFDAGESAATVLKNTSVPAIGTAHPDNSTLLATSISISDPKDGDVKKATYEVTVTYTKPLQGGSISSSTVQPWNRDPFNISYAPLEIVVPFQKAYDYTQDYNGAPSIPVLNKAGDPFEDSTTQQNLIMRFSYNLETFDPKWIVEYMDTINDEDIQLLGISIPDYHGRMKNLAASKMQTYDDDGVLEYEYWQVDVEIEISAVVWKKEIMERGLFALGTASTISTKFRIYIDTDGTLGNKKDLSAEAIPVDEPQKLNTDGTLYSSLTDAKYTTFYDRFAASWEELNLPGAKIRKDSIFKYSYGVSDL